MADDPRTTPVTPGDSASRRALVPASLDADLNLLLAERDREERILARAPRPGGRVGDDLDAIDEQILAGLVSP
jgi:hypothetical protein